MPRLIYIASPYTVGDQALNVRRQIEVADELLKRGHIAYCPCLNHFWHIISPKSWETWLKIDLEILSRCDAILRLDGISSGADIEVKEGLRLGMPIYYSLEDISNSNSGIKIKENTMKEIGIVWVVESGEYEDMGIDGVYDNHESAIEGIKTRYGYPYIVSWEEDSGVLIGHFETVLHYSIKHTKVFYITPFPLLTNN